MNRDTVSRRIVYVDDLTLLRRGQRYPQGLVECDRGIGDELQSTNCSLFRKIPYFLYFLYIRTPVQELATVLCFLEVQKESWKGESKDKNASDCPFPFEFCDDGSIGYSH